MNYTITSTYRNRTKIHFGDENEPLFDHEIVETYGPMDEQYVESVIAEFMDVTVGLSEPKFAEEYELNVPEDVRKEIVEHYKKRYVEFVGFMASVKDELFGGEAAEKSFDVAEDSNHDSENTKCVSSVITVRKST